MSKDFRTALEAYTGAEALRVGGSLTKSGHMFLLSGYSVAISNQGEAIFRVSDTPAEKNTGQASTSRTL